MDKNGRLVKPVYVTKPLMPPLDEFYDELKEIWSSQILTNNGQFHQQLEKALSDYLGIKYISLFSNGTLALITALQALRITGEVITTPFSFVATTHALWWNGIKPVFVDIENDFFNIDPLRIESAITPKTTAIMPVHVYGNPCDMNSIQTIADTYGLKVIYDAAHAFSVRVDNESLLNMGDLSILSFHATKVYNTIEGGAIVCHDEKTKKRIDFLKNFGFADEVTVVAPGINAKMNEIQAAFGLLQLKYVDESILKRKMITIHYRNLLKNIVGIRFLSDMENVRHNYSYFPILIDQQSYGMSRDELYSLLKSYNIFGRRYFYPLISDFPTYKGLESATPGNLKTAGLISKKVLCLPIFSDMELNIVESISKIIADHE